MSRFFFRNTGLALAAAFALTAPAQAALIIGFQFPGGATNQEVPETGGVYTVNIVASTNNGAATNLGVNAGYIGALSQVLNGSTIGGNITASAITVPGLQGTGFNHGALADRNADGRIDMGFADGPIQTSKGTVGWMRPTTGATTPVLLGGPSGVIGTFTVTIPANTGAGSNFLSFIPQLDPSGAGADWSWSETGTFVSGSVTGTGAGNVIVGSSVTFASAVVIPEPSTLALGGMLLVGLAGMKLRRKSA